MGQAPCSGSSRRRRRRVSRRGSRRSQGRAGPSKRSSPGSLLEGRPRWSCAPTAETPPRLLDCGAPPQGCLPPGAETSTRQREAGISSHCSKDHDYAEVCKWLVGIRRQRFSLVQEPLRAAHSVEFADGGPRVHYFLACRSQVDLKSINPDLPKCVFKKKQK